MMSKYFTLLRPLALPLFVLALDLAAVEVLSQITAFLITQYMGAKGPDFGDIAYYSKALIAVPVLLLGAGVFERRSFKEVGFAPRHIWRSILLGLGISASVMGVTTLVLVLAGWYHVQDVRDGVRCIVGVLFSGFLLYFVIALLEEVIFRGILFRLLERGLGSWLALAISALIFGWFHIGNPGASWISSAAIALEAGVTLAAAYMLTRNLWLCIGLHWGWNFFEGTVFGYSVSGTTHSVLIQSYTTGPSLWTGGEFGPEAGLITVLLSVLLFSTLLVLAVRQGKIFVPAFLSSLRLRRSEVSCR